MSVRHHANRRRRGLRTLASVVFVVAALNFVGFIVAGELIGGFTVHGGVANGQYYVARTARGPHTEVSKATFRYLQLHQFSMYVTHTLAIGLGWWVYRERRRT